MVSEQGTYKTYVNVSGSDGHNLEIYFFNPMEVKKK